MLNRDFLPLKVLIALCLLFLVGAWIYTLPIPLNGNHQWRQSDTLITGYYYFSENVDFAYPHVAARNNTEGIAIGEFPLFSYIIGSASKIYGHWSEVLPKIINIIFFIMAFFLWGKFLQNKWKGNEHHWLFWTMAFVFIPLNLTYLTIPMPEAAALYFFGGAAYLWSFQEEKYKSLFFSFAAVLFFIGFMIRPYHVWLLFVIAPSRRWMVPTLIVCVFGFFGWYRWWAGQVTTVPGYFGIGFESFRTVMQALPEALLAIPKRLQDQTAWIGLIPLWLGFKRSPLWGLGFLACWITMLILKPTHLPAHPYYLMNAGIFASVLMYLGFCSLSKQKMTVIGILFILISVISTQHHFHPNRNWPKIKMMIEQVESQSNSNDQVASYMGTNPMWFYFIKRKGSMFEPSEFNGPRSCPAYTQYFLRENEEGAFVFARCEN